MANAERLMQQGRLSECRRQKRELALEGKGRLNLLRQTLDPFEPDLTKLPLDQAKVELDRLTAIQDETRDLERQIADLEDFLGQG